MNNRPCYLEINLNSIKENFLNIKRHTNKKVIGIVKADAYGHGAIAVSSVLIQNGVDALGVATVEEAIELRREYSSIDILILGPVVESQILECLSNNISMTISSIAEGKLISSIAEKNGSYANVHVAVDTGMGRIGYFAHSFNENIIDDISDVLNIKNLRIQGIFTHFASADESDLSFMKHQYDIFSAIVKCLLSKGYSFEYIHSQNSAGCVNLKENICNTIRAGISLYGYTPSSDTPDILKLKPALNWKCKITHIKKVPNGTPIGYGSTYITDKDTTVATIPVGYADGLRRALSNGFNVCYNNISVPIIGRVCMDQSMIDASAIKDCKVGDVISLISELNPIELMAEHCGTINYEILCGISKRVPRIYLNN